MYRIDSREDDQNMQRRIAITDRIFGRLALAHMARAQKIQAKYGD